MKPSPLGLIFGVLCTIAPFAVAADDFASQLVKVTTSRGETFHNCKVLGFTPDTVTLMHDLGVKKVKLHQLPEALQQRFSYDEDKAMVFAQEEREQRKVEQEQAQIQQVQEAEQVRQELLIAADYRSRVAQNQATYVAQLQEQVLSASSSYSRSYVPVNSGYSGRYYARRYSNYYGSYPYYSTRPVIYYTPPSCHVYHRPYASASVRSAGAPSVNRYPSRPRTSVNRWVVRR